MMVTTSTIDEEDTENREEIVVKELGDCTT
jgi:hypothetical protein